MIESWLNIRRSHTRLDETRPWCRHRIDGDGLWVDRLGCHDLLSLLGAWHQQASAVATIDSTYFPMMVVMVMVVMQIIEHFAQLTDK